MGRIGGIAVRWGAKGDTWEKMRTGDGVSIYVREYEHVKRGGLGGLPYDGAKEGRGKDAHQGWREYMRARVRTR